MYRIRTGVVYATLASALWITGCVTKPPQAQTAELQRQAMQRWHACLERHAGDENVALLEVSKLMTQDCEGHKRDVVELFPRHMADQIDQILFNSGFRYIDSMDQNIDKSPLTSDPVQTVLR